MVALLDCHKSETERSPNFETTLLLLIGRCQRKLLEAAYSGKFRRRRRRDTAKKE
jgi:hypothetical protein